MSTNHSTVDGKIDELTGKIKQGAGELVGNEDLANRGAAQQVKGHAEQAWGAVKEAAQEIHDKNQPRAEETTQHVRERITEAAADAKQHVKDAADSVASRS